MLWVFFVVVVLGLLYRQILLAIVKRTSATVCMRITQGPCKNAGAQPPGILTMYFWHLVVGTPSGSNAEGPWSKL